MPKVSTYLAQEVWGGSFVLRLICELLPNFIKCSVHFFTENYDEKLYTWKVTEKEFKITFFRWANPGLFFIYFRLFKQTLQFLQQINVKKCPSSIRRQDSNSQPSDCESPP